MFLIRSLTVFLFVLSVKSSIENRSSIEDTFKQCLISQPTGTVGHCLGIGAISKLQSLDSDAEFDLVEGVTLTKESQEFRDDYNFAERDPSDLRTIVDSFSHVFSKRSMRWDMGFLYPGLAMHLAPSTSPGGTLEFLLDPHRESLNAHSLKEASTGRVLARQFLVPFLLGFKFNIATILPVLFGILALIAKKALIISKLALIVSSAYGLGTLLLGNKQPPQQGEYHNPGQFNPGFGNYHYNRYHPSGESGVEAVYRGMDANLNGNADPLRLYANLQEAYDREDKTSKGRNFAWSEAEKIKKTSA